MPVVIREESVDSVETRSSLAVILTVLVLAAVFALGYFAWYVPNQAAAANPTVIEHQTDVVHDQPATTPPTTIVNTPAPQAPVVVQGQPGPKGDQGAQGPQGPKGDPPGNIGDNAPVTTGN